MSSTSRVQSLILQQLNRGEMEVLALTAAVRRAVTPADRIKGDLPTMVKSALRVLVACNAVKDHDGRYSISPSARA